MFWCVFEGFFRSIGSLSDTELPQCKTVGKCGKCADGSYFNTEEECEAITGNTFCGKSKGDKCGKLKCGKGGYLIGSGKDDCVEPTPKCPKCTGKQVNFNECGNCVDKQEVCDADEE